MDYLDLKKEFRQRIMLMLGYVLIAIAVVTTTLLLVYRAYGYNFGKNGALIQDGLVFFSSQPNPANIYVNGTLNSATTNTRLFLPSGVYNFKLTRSGYRNWTRTVTVDGGAVEHFDYPFLVPTTLTTKSVHSYASAPGLMTESNDQNWVLIQKPGSSTDFDLYNISNPQKPVITTLSLPSSLLGKASSSESWKIGAWSDDNKHVLLEHIYDGNIEYILLDRSEPSQSVNLTDTYNFEADEVELVNDKYNSFYAFNAQTGVLSSANLNSTTATPLLQHVLAYKSYGNNTILYVTDEGAPAGEVEVKIYDSGKIYNIRTLPASSTYLLNLTTYSGTPYVAVGSNAANKVYIYQDPVSQLNGGQSQVLVPIWVLNVNQPNYLSFSDNAQFIMAENGTTYSVYDIENNLGYNYTDSKQTVDAPQTNATWMDGDRLDFVSNSKLIIQDYDNNNRQTLIPASPAYLPAFSSNYKYLYTLEGSSSGQYELDSTPLQTSADL
jgi:hypothetical protein